MRIRLLSFIITGCFIILLTALFYLQAVRGESYYALAEKNRLRLISLEAPRGKIFDRFGIALAEDRLSYDVCVIPQDIKNLQQTMAKLSGALNRPAEKLWSMYRKNRTLPFMPATVVDGVSRNQMLLIEEQRHTMPGVTTQIRFRRFYNRGETISHVVGFIGEIGPEELTEKKTYGYRYRDYTGKAGIEKVADAYLMGMPGGVQIEVNNLGQQVKTLGKKEPVRGKDITLTIDSRLQSYIAELMENKKGAVVVIEPFTGELLAMVSSPGFNPNNVEESLTRTGSPHINRAISSGYAPGSILKLVTAICGLEQNISIKDKYIVCNGNMKIGESVFRCWKENGHGPQNLQDAIIHSCNIFFYNLGLKTGQGRLIEWLFNLGLGKATKIELPNESAGLIPSPSWKRLHLSGEKWFDGDTANLAIGQGYLLVTPLQTACMVSVIANGGWFIYPHIIKRIGDKQVAHIKGRHTGCSKATLDIIRDAMIKVVDDPEGTGFRAKVDGIKIAAKTGTAQTHIAGHPHAWFVGFAPAEKPKIAFCVFIEHGGSGGLLPADIVKNMIEFYLQNDIAQKS